MRYAGAGWEDAADRRLLCALHAWGRRRPAVAAAARTLSYAGEHGALWLAAGLAAAAADPRRRGPWLRATTLTATAHLAAVALKPLARRPRPVLTPTPGAAPPPGAVAPTAAPPPGAPVPVGAGAAAPGGGGARSRAAPAPGSGASSVVAGPGVAGPAGFSRKLPAPVVGRYSFPSSHAASAAAAAVAFGAVRPGVRWMGVPVAAAMCVSRLVVGVHYPTDVAAGALLGGAVTAVADRFCNRCRRG